jgi:hypothetical protein
MINASRCATYFGQHAPQYHPVVTNARFETRADGKRYRTLTVNAAPLGAHAGSAAPLSIVYSRPRSSLKKLTNYLIAVFTSLGMFCGLATGWVALKVSRHALLPLPATAETIAAIDEKNLSQRIDEAKLPVELVPMTNRLNELLDAPRARVYPAQAVFGGCSARVAHAHPPLCSRRWRCRFAASATSAPSRRPSRAP